VNRQKWHEMAMTQLSDLVEHSLFQWYFRIFWRSATIWSMLKPVMGSTLKFVRWHLVTGSRAAKVTPCLTALTPLASIHPKLTQSSRPSDPWPVSSVAQQYWRRIRVERVSCYRHWTNNRTLRFVCYNDRPDLQLAGGRLQCRAHADVERARRDVVVWRRCHEFNVVT